MVAKSLHVVLIKDTLLLLFANKLTVSVAQYINSVEQGVNKTISDNLQQQVFLGDDNFVEKHQLMQELLEANVSEISFKNAS